MGDERSGCGSGTETLVPKSSDTNKADATQQQYEQQQYEQHQREQQNIICGKCRANNSTI